MLIALVLLPLLAFVTSLAFRHEKAGASRVSTEKAVGPGGGLLGGFALWALAGALVCAGALTGFTIGILILPVGLAVLLLAARLYRSTATRPGVIAGAGVTLVASGFAWPSGGPGRTPFVLAGASLIVMGSLLTTFMHQRQQRP